MPMSEELITQLRRHPDHESNQVRSGLRWWDHGLRQAFVWKDAEGPVCMQWLVTARDNSKLRTLPVWGGMYPPIGAHVGQIEHLFVFSNVHRVGIAVQFMYAMYDVMRREGLTEVITHIPEDNAPMRALAERLGWTHYGSITRYQLDVPGLRPVSAFLHRADRLPTSAP
jgi:GNAT superfamily N-acetyltransferase